MTGIRIVSELILRHPLYYLLLALFLPACSGSGSAPSPGTIEREAITAKFKRHYDERLDSFRRENDSLRRIPGDQTKPLLLFIGDSFTERIELNKYFPNYRCLNRGISSDHIRWDNRRGVLYRLRPEETAHDPSLIFLLIGVNDIGDDASGEAVHRSILLYNQIVDSIQSGYSSSQFFAFTLLPTTGRFTKLNPAIRQFNRELKALSLEKNFSCIDIHPLYADENGELDASMTSDGLHINEAGYKKWIEAIRLHCAIP
jgi:lysophospholipase L1-like esterase